MTATAHALVGGAIAASIPDPVLSVSLSLISHPLLDMVPHWDLGTNILHQNRMILASEATVDLFGGVFVSWLIFGQNIPLWYFLAAVFASESWDIVTIPYWLFKWRFFPISWIYKFQDKINHKAGLPGGIINQIIAIGIIVLLLRII